MSGTEQSTLPSPASRDELKHYWFSRIWLPEGWERSVRVSVDDAGVIHRIETSVEPRQRDEKLGATIPGIPNSHCHAFQRAMAGMAEQKQSNGDSFWTWRNKMYEIANSISPDELFWVAAQLYVEMLKAGFTTVAEFHYLHHSPDGRPYSRPETLSNVLMDAASHAGIGMTLMPVLYMCDDFDRYTLDSEKRRFGCTLDAYLEILGSVIDQCKTKALSSASLAIHSLRAVPPASLHDALVAYSDMSPDGMIHIHIAEQLLEVERSIEFHGARPVDWLLSNCKVDQHWCLVHATHMTARETVDLANCGAVVSLCPTTEANLGDGIFALEEFLSEGGAISVGSDSNVTVSPIEELRLLEYGQRLSRKRRNIIATTSMSHTGDRLLSLALEGGRQACGQNIGRIEPGFRADWLVLDEDSVSLSQVADEYLVDTTIFAGPQTPIRHVMVGGRWQVRDFKHVHQLKIADRFVDAVANLRVRMP